jgi:hypothetical protein
MNNIKIRCVSEEDRIKIIVKQQRGEIYYTELDLLTEVKKYIEDEIKFSQWKYPFIDEGKTQRMDEFTIIFYTYSLISK